MEFTMDTSAPNIYKYAIDGDSSDFPPIGSEGNDPMRKRQRHFAALSEVDNAYPYQLKYMVTDVSADSAAAYEVVAYCRNFGDRGIPTGDLDSAPSVSEEQAPPSFPCYEALFEYPHGDELSTTWFEEAVPTYVWPKVSLPGQYFSVDVDFGCFHDNSNPEQTYQVLVYDMSRNFRDQNGDLDLTSFDAAAAWPIPVDNQSNAFKFTPTDSVLGIKIDLEALPTFTPTPSPTDTPTYPPGTNTPTDTSTPTDTPTYPPGVNTPTNTPTFTNTPTPDLARGRDFVIIVQKKE
jgi:hypothetical protein